MLASIKDLINQKSHANIKHVEPSIQLDQEIDELSLEDSLIDHKITVFENTSREYKEHFCLSHLFIFYEFYVMTFFILEPFYE